MNCDIVNMKYKTTKTLNLFILKNSACGAIEKGAVKKQLTQKAPKGCLFW